MFCKILSKPHIVQKCFHLQVDARLLRAVAIEHPKDPDESASVVLSEILPSLPSDSTPSRTKSSSPSIPEREGTSLAIEKYNLAAALACTFTHLKGFVTLVDKDALFKQ